jgi:hypothetical protein
LSKLKYIEFPANIEAKEMFCNETYNQISASNSLPLVELIFECCFKFFDFSLFSAFCWKSIDLMNKHWVLLASAITCVLHFFEHVIIHIIFAETNTRDNEKEALWGAWLLIILSSTLLLLWSVGNEWRNQDEYSSTLLFIFLIN